MRRIRFRHKRNKGCWGKAYYKHYEIEIDPALDGQSHLDIALHEALHCIFPQTDEDVINQAGITLADLLWRLGYRREDQES